MRLLKIRWCGGVQRIINAIPKCKTILYRVIHIIPVISCKHTLNRHIKGLWLHSSHGGFPGEDVQKDSVEIEVIDSFALSHSEYTLNIVETLDLQGIVTQADADVEWEVTNTYSGDKDEHSN